MNGYYTTIATKISKADKAKLCTIAKGFGLSFYELQQALLLSLIRYFDKDSFITYEHNIMLNAFGNVFAAIGDSYNPISITGHQSDKIEKAIMFVNRGKANRPQVMAIGKDRNGNLTESYNQDQMLTDYLQATDPQLLKVLRYERDTRDNFSLSQTLRELVLQRASQPSDMMEADIKAMFEDVRIPTGDKINEDVFYKRGHNKGDYSNYTPHATRKRADL